MADYRYTEIGLDNVVITGLKVKTSDDGANTYTVPNLLGLHRVISHSLITKATGLSGKELRFLRTEMGITQAELAQIVKKDQQSVGRWERGETPLDQNAELILRLLAAERLQLDTNMSVEELAARCMPSVKFSEIRIDGSNPKKYKAIEEKIAA